MKNARFIYLIWLHTCPRKSWKNSADYTDNPQHCRRILKRQWCRNYSSEICTSLQSVKPEKFNYIHATSTLSHGSEPTLILITLLLLSLELYKASTDVFSEGIFKVLTQESPGTSAYLHHHTVSPGIAWSGL